MELPRAEMPVKTAAEITLTSEEKRLAAQETRNVDIHGHTVNFPSSELETRYAYSKYLLDPGRLSWSKTRKVLALVFRFISLCRKEQLFNQTLGTPLEPVTPTSQEYEKADFYLFSKATCEVKKFAAPAEYKNCSIEKKGILYFNGRLLGTEEILSMEKTMFDLNPTSFCKPVVERHSPIAFSILIENHWDLHHASPAATYRESLGTAYIISGRALAQLIRNECPFCKRYRAKKLQVEMGKIHQNRLVVAPPFTFCQTDLMGPFEAQCEHNHRATVKVWGAVFKCPATGAVAVFVMSGYDTPSYLKAYTRFAARYGHPIRLYLARGPSWSRRRPR
jgi:hypothetical protein